MARRRARSAGVRRRSGPHRRTRKRWRHLVEVEDQAREARHRRRPACSAIVTDAAGAGGERRARFVSSGDTSAAAETASCDIGRREALAKPRGAPGAPRGSQVAAHSRAVTFPPSPLAERGSWPGARRDARPVARRAVRVLGRSDRARIGRSRRRREQVAKQWDALAASRIPRTDAARDRARQGSVKARPRLEQLAKWSTDPRFDRWVRCSAGHPTRAPVRGRTRRGYNRSSRDHRPLRSRPSSGRAGSGARSTPRKS